MRTNVLKTDPDRKSEYELRHKQKKGKLRPCDLCGEGTASPSGVRVPISDEAGFVEVSSANICRDCYNKYLEVTRNILKEKEDKKKEAEMKKLSEEDMDLSKAIDILNDRAIGPERREFLLNLIKNMADAR